MRKLSSLRVFLLITVFLAGSTPGYSKTKKTAVPPKKPLEIAQGMTQSDLYKIYPRLKARTYRVDGPQEWWTFDHPEGVITFHLKNASVASWKINDRSEVVNEYLSEFASLAFKQSFPVIDAAIRDVLMRMPYEDFLKVTGRQRPILFTEFFDSGTAQFANSSEIISLPDDVPAFQNGFTMIKLSTGLAAMKDQQAIEGVVAHEIAHRVLEHIKNGKRDCNAEREANRLIKQWGFGVEYAQASYVFGHEAHGEGENPCKDQ